VTGETHFGNATPDTFAVIVEKILEAPSMALAYDADGDGQVSDPTITGQTALLLDGDLCRIEFDFDNNGTAEVDVIPLGGGEFTFVPTAATPGTVSGTNRVRARTVQRTAEGPFVYSNWGLPLEFTVEASSAPSMAALTLLTDTGLFATDKVTSNPTLTGLVTDPDGNLEGLTVEFYYGSTAAGSTTTDANGRFTFTPSLPSYTTATAITAKVKEWDNWSSTYLYDSTGDMAVTET